MPVYHFTFHAYGTWLPDRPEGYYVFGHGWQPPSNASGERYRSTMNQPPVAFTPEMQQHLLAQLIPIKTHQRLALYAAAIDPSHVHLVAAWTDDRDVVRLRSQIKYSLTRALCSRFAKRQWFVDKAGQTRVNDIEHLHHLVHEYLRKHTVYWLPDGNDSDKR